MAEKVTLQPASLGFRPVGGTGEYTNVKGVLDGMALAKDANTSTSIVSQFSDNPFAILEKGNPQKLTFELTQYALADLPALFGGTYTAASTTADETYDEPVDAFSTELEWLISYKQGNQAYKIFRGHTIGSVKQDNNAGLNYSVTITALLYNDGTKDYTTQIIGDPKTA